MHLGVTCQIIPTYIILILFLMNSKQAYTTEIVKALFGSSVGDVVNDFSCSYQRQAGRLYVSTEGLFFYSNLFGFEKKVRILYKSTTTITKIRTTSLLVKTIDASGEDYIFRSFENREYVLEIIFTYHSNIDADTVTVGEQAATTPIFSTASQEEGGVDAVVSECDNSLDESDDDHSLGGNDRPPEPEISSDAFQPNIPKKKNIAKKKEATDTGRERNSASSGTTSRTSVDKSRNEKDDAKQWEKIKQTTKGWESAIVNLKLPCNTAQDFFHLFLMDDATNCLSVFLKECGDTNVSIGAWQHDTKSTQEEKTLTRQINYDHKSGLAVAKVSRHQTYQSFGIHAAYLKNITKITGIKAVPSDTFFVEDMWLIESSEKAQGIILNIRFHVIFTKSTMLKGIISKRAMTEARELYSHYVLFLRKKMHHKVPAGEEIGAPTTTPARSDWVEILLSLARQYMPDLSTISRNAPILFIAILAFMIYRLKQRVIFLEGMLEAFEQRLFDLERIGLDVQPPTETIALR